MARRWSLSTLVVCAVAVTACASASARSVDTTTTSVEPTTTASTTSTTLRISPMTPTDPSRITPAARAAIEALGSSGADVPGSAHAHGHDETAPHIELPLFTGDAGTFADQWLAAQRSVVVVDTIDKAAALGYVRASAWGPGIGTHWVSWTQIAKPFDPAHPAMLLFDERRQPAVLVGYSYWVRSATAPVGFAGGNDEWHQHTGYCVVNGYVDREEAPSAAQCAGTYLAGGDLWMLHAWVVPAYPDRLGKFAVYNPSLCPSRIGTPDISRCPD